MSVIVVNYIDYNLLQLRFSFSDILMVHLAVAGNAMLSKITYKAYHLFIIKKQIVYWYCQVKYK